MPWIVEEEWFIESPAKNDATAAERAAVLLALVRVVAYGDQPSPDVDPTLVWVPGREAPHTRCCVDGGRLSSTPGTVKVL
jgi:hypothetical protein